MEVQTCRIGQIMKLRERFEHASDTPLRMKSKRYLLGKSTARGIHALLDHLQNDLLVLSS